MGLLDFIEDVVVGTATVAAGATKAVVGTVPALVGEDDLLTDGLEDVVKGVTKVVK